MINICSSSSARRGSHTSWRLYLPLSPPAPPVLHSEYCNQKVRDILWFREVTSCLCVQTGEEQRRRREPSEWQVLQEDTLLPHHHTQRILQAGLRLQRGASPRVQPRAQSELGESERRCDAALEFIQTVRLIFCHRPPALRWPTLWTAACSQL